MRKKFTIYQNGVKYKPQKGSSVVMNSEGLFFLVYQEDFYTYTKKLHEVIGNYDVVWKGESE